MAFGSVLGVPGGSLQTQILCCFIVRQVDMLVGDIYGDRDYSSIGLSASTIASSFGKVIARALSSSKAIAMPGHLTSGTE